MESEMGLIEQLGGYEATKEYLKKNSHFINFEGLERFYDDLLEYRRQHNIFEFGDSIVFDNTKQYCTRLPDDIMTYESAFDTDARVRQGGRFFAVSFVAIRHATDEEIKAGRRL